MHITSFVRHFFFFFELLLCIQKYYQFTDVNDAHFYPSKLLLPLFIFKKIGDSVHSFEIAECFDSADIYIEKFFFFSKLLLDLKVFLTYLRVIFSKETADSVGQSSVALVNFNFVLLKIIFDLILLF